MRLTLLVGLVVAPEALQLSSTAARPASRAAGRLRSPICQADDAEPGDGGFYGGFGAAAGLIANPVVLCSLYDVASTGTGLDPGPYGLLGALEGVSFLAVVGVAAAAIFSKVSKGSGLPAGKLGLLGLSEGLSFLSLLLAVLVFPGREFGLVGDPATAAINVPEVTAQVAATLGPLAEQLSAAVAPLVEQASKQASEAGGQLAAGGGVDLSTLKLPDVSSIKLPEGLPDVSSIKLPEGLPDVSSLKMPDVSSLKLPEGLPDVSSLKLPEGLPGLPLPDAAPDAVTPTAATAAPAAEGGYMAIPKYDPGY